MVKFIFVLAGLDGCDAWYLETVIRSHLMEHRVAGCDACAQDAVIRSHLMKHRMVEHGRFSQYLTLEFFQINFGKSFLKFHLILECFFKGYF